MSENVSRLKELLFDGETRTLAELQQRIDAVASQEVRTRTELAAELKRLAESQPAELRRLAQIFEQERNGIRRFAEMSERDRAEMRRQLAETGSRQDALTHRLEAVFERAGTQERLELSVAGVIDGALRRAEIDRHDDLAQAMAPLVVRTIKTEIRNSRDELAEALYPLTGRMVKAYVASAMKDLVDEINRRLEQNALMLRLRSLVTGRSLAELALADAQRVAVQEVYLIRRGTGELVGRWPHTAPHSEQDQVMSGILAAINDFASEAFKGDGSALRHVDLEASQVYLRASPAYLLAVRCNGTAHAAVERAIDDEFLRAIERYDAALTNRAATGHGPDDSDQALAELSTHLVERIDRKQDEIARPLKAASPLKILALLLAIPLIGWLSWSVAEDLTTGRVRQVAQHVIDTSTEIKGYPVAATVTPWGRTVTLTGLAPSDAAREDVVKRISDLLQGTEIRDQLSVVPTGGYDTRPQIAEVRGDIARIEADAERLSLMRALARARLRLEQATPDLAQLQDATAGPARHTVAAASAAVEHTVAALRAESQKLGSPRSSSNDLAAAMARLGKAALTLAGASSDLAGLIGEGARLSLPHAVPTHATAVDAADDVAAQAERLGAMAIAVHQASLSTKRIPPPTGPSAREELARFVETHAVFFANGTEYRSDANAQATLDEAARHFKANKVRIRVVGYTDEPGGSSVNTALSQARAARVQAELVDRGVPVSRLVTLGRSQGPNISATTGPQSPNRRVAFEIGYEGEDAE